jgi:hypothetical protein
MAFSDVVRLDPGPGAVATRTTAPRYVRRCLI